MSCPFSLKFWLSRCLKKVRAATMINNVQTRCIVKGEAQKSPFFWRFFGGFWFSQERLFSRNSTRKPLNLKKSPIFTNTPCKSTCLYNAPSMHTVEMIVSLASVQMIKGQPGQMVSSFPLERGWARQRHGSCQLLGDNGTTIGRPLWEGLRS